MIHVLKMTTAKKRIYGLITAVVFAMTLLPLSGLFDRAGAAAAGTEDETFSFILDGKGTEEAPYIIDDKDDLENMREAIAKKHDPGSDKTAAVSAYYKLNADITNLGSWTPIGRNVEFTGTFDGNGHKITEMNVTKVSGGQRADGYNYGLFGQIGTGGTVKNLTVEGTANINGGWFVGLIAGANKGTIQNCYVKGSVNAVYQFGGIVGAGNSGTIKNCFADVTSTSTSSSGKFGAIAGTADNVSDTCYVNHGDVAISVPTGDQNKNIPALTDDDVKNGKAAWILRQNQDGDMYWGQKLSESKEDVPSLKGTDEDRVYKAEFVLKTTTEEVTVAEEFANKDGTFAKPTVTYDKDGQTAGDKWYENLDDEDKSEYSFDTLVTKDIKLYNSGSYKDYTITLNVGDGTLTADGWETSDDGKTYTKTYNKGTETFTLPTPTAPKDQKFAGWEDNAVTGEQATVTINKGSTGSKVYTAKYRSAIGPVITATLDGHSWSTMSTDVADVYVKNSTVTVKASVTDEQDKDVPITIYYYTSDEVLTAETLKGYAINYWTVYNTDKGVPVSPANKTNRRYVYFKATDKDGNVTCISTAAIVFDLSAPTISGIKNGGIYCESIDFTVNDANLLRVQVGDQMLFDDSVVAASDDVVAAAVGDNKFTAKFDHDGSKTVAITVTDKAGNETVYNVTINGKHTPGITVTEMRKAASCVNIGEGTKLTYCKVCNSIIERNDNYTEKMTDHSWSAWKVVSSVTCGDTSRERRCRNCGLIETQTEGGSHKWAEEYTIDKEPTCINPGYMSKHCTVCGISNPDDIVPVGTLAHQAGSTKTVVLKEATCTDEGQKETTVYCANCNVEMGKTYETLPAKGHVFSEWAAVETNNHESTTLQRVCTICGYSETETDDKDHVWDTEWTIDKAPTCTTDGSRSHHCKNGCGSTNEAEVIPATGHTPQEAVREAVMPATCTDAGRYNDVVYCATCKAIIKSTPVTVPAEGHKFGEWEEVKTANGEVNEQRKCEVCGYTETRGMDLENHKWNTEYTIDVEPTCTAEGSRSIHCSVCGLTKPGSSETIKAKGHTWGDWKELVSPDCDDSGAQERECTECHTKETKNLSPNGHTWNEDFTIDKEATCTTDGSKSIYCTKCGAVKESETIPAKGHSFGEWVEVISKSTGEANEERTCTVCGFTETRGADLVNHNWDKDYTIDVVPTCTTEGSKSIHCSVCGLKKDSEVIPALGHDFGEWKDISSPDCDDEGTQERECKVCGTKETNNLSAKGHTWEDKYTVDKPATCFEDGSESIHCSKCDAVKDSRTIPAPGHHTPAAERKGAKAATATEDGYTGDVVCQACGEVLEKGEVIPATMGNIDVIPESGKGAPAIKLNESTKIALEDAALTDAEKEALGKGANIDIVLSIDDATSTVTDEDKALTDTVIKDKYTIGQYVTIDITKTIDGKEFAVTQLGKEISLTIEVPDSLKADGRTFAIVRLHDGKADILSDTDSDANTITFKTDKFSVYAIVYADKASEPTPPAITEPDSSKPDDSKTEDSKPDESKPDSSLNDNSPATGGDFSLVFVILAAAVLGAICVIRKENKAR